MFIIEEESKLDYHLEAIDIEDCEYTGWDAEAKPIEFYLEGKKVKVRCLSSEPQTEQLRGAMLSYAKAGNSKKQFVGRYDNVKELFQAIEQHVNEARLSNRIHRKASEFIKKLRKK